MIRIPGLIDPHVHLRVPGGEHKEDFKSGTRAALAGGFTTLLAMPNTNPPLVSLEAHRIAQNLARTQSLCDVFLYAGASGENLDQLSSLGQEAVALKIYMDQTYGPLLVKGLSVLMRIVELWPRKKPICLHAEGESVAVGLALAQAYRRPMHFCHISRGDEIDLIRRAKANGLPVTCEVTPHHLFLDESDANRLGAFGDMRPVLQPAQDVEALWKGIADGTVDCIGSDHAPHAIWEKLDFGSEAEWEEANPIQNAHTPASRSLSHEEDYALSSYFHGEGLRCGQMSSDFACEEWKDAAHSDLKANRQSSVSFADSTFLKELLEQKKGDRKSPPGVPELESTLPLMLTAVHEERISLERAIELMHDAPKRIFHLAEQPETWVEIDPESTYSFPDHPLYTKCGWSPFEGRQMTGRVVKTVYKSHVAYSDGQIFEK